MGTLLARAYKVLYHFGVSAEQAKRLRIKLARDVAAKLNRTKATITAEAVAAWIGQNT